MEALDTVKIGIVLTHWTDKEICGYLSDSRAGLILDKLCSVILKHDVERHKKFTLNLKTQVYETDSFCDICESKEIGRELKKIGFKNVKLRFKGEIHEIKDEE